ncbi:uncharacterized protein LOC134774743 [Penaeus indicus]|uniref:uncharacterized protein LOC134774743 n=1 Tax=Penaeus indicus TaxID=29960 RepID=UPI00300DB811
MEKYREKQIVLHMLFIDLEKAYDRVPRQEVWRCMRQRGVTEKYVRMIQETYKNVSTKVRCTVRMTDWFEVMSHHGAYYMSMTSALESRGLKISRKKTIQIDGLNLKRVDHFKYFGVMVEEDGSMGREIKHRIQCGWNNWKKVSGVICDKRMPVKLKGKVHKSVVRPAMTYGLETAPLRRVEERKLDVAEMKMLRWMKGVTKMDGIWNNYLSGSKSIQDSRL